MRRSIVTAAAGLAIFVGTANLPLASVRAGTATQSTAKTGKLEKIKAALQQLNLSETQKGQIKEILTTAKSQLQTAKGASTVATAGKTKVKGTGAGVMQKIVSVLTTEQKVKFKGLMGSEKA